MMTEQEPIAHTAIVLVPLTGRHRDEGAYIAQIAGYGDDAHDGDLWIAQTAEQIIGAAIVHADGTHSCRVFSYLRGQGLENAILDLLLEEG